MRNTVEILGVKIDKVTMSGALENVKRFLDEDRVHVIYTPNAEFMMDAQRDETFRNILNQSDMNIADGAGIILASKILGLDIPEKVAGVDLSTNTFSLSTPQRKIRYFLFGSKPGVAETAAENIKHRYPDVEIAGLRNGYFSESEDSEIVNLINSTKPDIVLVALGKVKQEKWIHKHKNELSAKICIGVGGTLDILAGKATLAPEFFRRNGLEWLYRLCKEPRRFVRMLDLPKFVLRVLAYKITGR